MCGFLVQRQTKALHLNNPPNFIKQTHNLPRTQIQLLSNPFRQQSHINTPLYLPQGVGFSIFNLLIQLLALL
jgi:hypothetical protein